MNQTFASRIAHQWLIQAAATPLPSNLEGEIGLMTLQEYLHFRNRSGKTHPSDAYDFDTAALNRTYMRELGSIPRRKPPTFVYESRTGGYLFREKGDEGMLVGVLAPNGTLYHTKWVNPTLFTSYDTHDGHVQLPVKQTKVVKYLSDYAPLVDSASAKNLRKYPYVYQRILNKGEPMTIRFEAPPVKGEDKTIVIMNEIGQVVAQAADEWGATLLTVAKEYRGRRLGPLIGKIWYLWNPQKASGGFTPQGRANAVAMWRDRVRELLSWGWYTDLIRRGDITSAKVKSILRDVGTRPTPEEVPMKRKAQPLVYIDPGQSFYIYDMAFLQDPDEKYLYGYGFFRDSGAKVFLFKIEYERPYKDLANAVALQMAKDAGDEIYVGEGYGDTLEINPRWNVQTVGPDRIRLAEDLLDLRDLASLERQIRRKLDPQREAETLIMEMAEAKSW